MRKLFYKICKAETKEEMQGFIFRVSVSIMINAMLFTGLYYKVLHNMSQNMTIC